MLLCWVFISHEIWFHALNVAVFFHVTNLKTNKKVERNRTISFREWREREKREEEKEMKKKWLISKEKTVDENTQNSGKR